jgi:hypothetical protein
LGQFESRLDQLSGKVTAVYGSYWQPSVGDGLSRVHHINYPHARSTPTSVPSTMSNSHSNCRCDNNNDIKKHSVNLRVWAETNWGACEFTCEDDVVVGDVHCSSSSVSDWTLPKFNDCKRQHLVLFCLLQWNLILMSAHNSGLSPFVQSWETTIASSGLSQNCNAAHKSNLKCSAPYTKTDSVRTGTKICQRIFYNTQWWWQIWHKNCLRDHWRYRWPLP